VAAKNLLNAVISEVLDCHFFLLFSLPFSLNFHFLVPRLSSLFVLLDKPTDVAVSIDKNVPIWPR